MRSKNEILADAEKRIAHLEYFDSMIGLSESQRADLALLKELVVLVKLCNQYEWERDIAIEQLHELGIGFGAKVDHIKERLERTQWIPCSERLPQFQPEKMRKVLVTMEDKKGCRFTTTAKYHEKYEEWVEFADWRYGDFKVVAWMERPEPYTVN